ncbi:MAG: hypothetical protein KAH38_03520 [Candidatus Hydrogenedentes bacterium]|nr:hypothetical protein [Candidatus Hydrogenedentota bacterium]
MTPIFAVIIGILSWVVFCWVRIWLGSFQVNSNNSLCVLLSSVTRGFFLVLYTFLGIFLLDIAFRICFLDFISYGSFSYVIAPVILCTSLGILYIVKCVFVAPTWTTLLACGGTIGVYLYLSVTAPFQQLDSSLSVGSGLVVIATIIDVFWTRKRPVIMSPPLWNVSHKFNRIITAKVYVGILVLFSVELVLLFEGLSLLYWL